jgi:hypothetical protein
MGRKYDVPVGSALTVTISKGSNTAHFYSDGVRGWEARLCTLLAWTSPNFQPPIEGRYEKGSFEQA